MTIIMMATLPAQQLAAAGTTRPAMPRACPRPSPPEQQNYGGGDIRQLITTNYSACAAACCAEARCLRWNWDSNLEPRYKSPACRGPHLTSLGPCCWLKGAGSSKGKHACGSPIRQPNCTPWSGVSGRLPP
eukprot:SAG25_NODE_6549_length_551_cov_1.466814_1_plen_130_part_01